MGEISERNRQIWVLSDPDVIANHGLAREGNAALAVDADSSAARRRRQRRVRRDRARLRRQARASPFLLLFRFPFVVATVQGLIAVALLLWATLARFGAPQSAPPALRAGREGLLENMAKLIEFTGHQQVMMVSATSRRPSATSRASCMRRAGFRARRCVAWLQRVGAARGADVDCGAVVRRRQRAVGTARRRDLTPLVRLARDIHRWKGEIVDGRSRHPRDH